MSHQTTVTFTNRKGLRLVGILHSPSGRAATDLGLLLLSPGVKMRLGPQGLYKRMADHFAGLGIPVLRFDFHGLGDSEGTLKEELLRDFYNHIEVGRYVEDTLDAMDWMQQHHQTRRFVLSGLCGGAITGLLTGARDARVAGLLALGITPLLASRSANPASYVTVGQLGRMRRSYVKKLLKPAAWIRLLTFQSDYRIIWRSLVQPFKRRLRRQGAAAIPAGETDNASPLFPPAFFGMLDSGRPMLLVFGGSDRLQWEFEEKFVARHQERLATSSQGYQLHSIEHANHVLSLSVWQKEMLDVSTRWLVRHFPNDLSAESPVEAGADRATA